MSGQKLQTIILYGMSASGKSTLMRSLMERSTLAALDLDRFVGPFIAEYGNDGFVGTPVSQMYDLVIAEVAQHPYDIVEAGTEFPHILPALFAGIRRHGRRPVLVHCVIPYETAQARNSERARPVPEGILKDQHEKESTGTFRDECARAGVEVVEIGHESLELAVTTMLGEDVA